LQKLNAGQFAQAVQAFETADTYPENLEVGRPADGGHSPKVFYLLGKAYQKLGNTAKAAECFQTAGTSEGGRRGAVTEQSFFRSMALQELGKNADSNNEINRLTESVERQLNSPAVVDEYSKFGEDGSRSERLAQLQYQLGLVQLARGESEKAAASFKTAVQANPDLVWAKVFLEHGEELLK